MSNPQLLRTVTLATSAIVVGEALALFVGMHVLSGRDNPWLSPKNDVFLAIDLVMGVALMYTALADQWHLPSPVFYGSIAVAMLAHGVRAWEYLGGAGGRFCINPPLFWDNASKTLGLLAAGAVAIFGWTNI